MIFYALLLASKTPLPPPSIHAREEGALVTHDKYGKERWRAQWTLRQITEDDRLLVRFTETGEGYYSHFPQRVRWTMKSYWEFGERFSPLFYEKTFSDMEGVPVVVERRRFDWKKGTVRFEREDKIGDRGVDEELEVPPTTWTVDGLATALRSLPFDSPRPVKVHLLTDEPKLYKVTFTIQGTEPIRSGEGCAGLLQDQNGGEPRFFRQSFSSRCCPTFLSGLPWSLPTGGFAIEDPKADAGAWKSSENPYARSLHFSSLLVTKRRKRRITPQAKACGSDWCRDRGPPQAYGLHRRTPAVRRGGRRSVEKAGRFGYCSVNGH